jgi:polar amino acid transport system substrate-binding protein
MVLAMGLAAMAASVPALAETTLERAKKQGFIRVGFANEAPYGYATPDGKLTGESPEVVKAVLQKIGIAQVDGRRAIPRRSRTMAPSPRTRS